MSGHTVWWALIIAIEGSRLLGRFKRERQKGLPERVVLGDGCSSYESPGRLVLA